jgi:hypothetical protein
VRPARDAGAAARVQGGGHRRASGARRAALHVVRPTAGGRRRQLRHHHHRGRRRLQHRKRNNFVAPRYHITFVCVVGAKKYMKLCVVQPRKKNLDAEYISPLCGF